MDGTNLDKVSDKFMIYKVNHNANAEVYLEDKNGVDYEYKRVYIYFDTYISSNNLVEVFLSPQGLKIYKFMISESETDENSPVDKIENFDEDDPLHDYMYVPEMFVEEIEIEESDSNLFGKNWAMAV